MDSVLRKLLASEKIDSFLKAIGKRSPVEVSLVPAQDAVSIRLPDGGNCFVRGDSVQQYELFLISSALENLFAFEYEVSDLTRELSNLYEEITLLYQLAETFSGKLQWDKIQKSAIDEISCTLGVDRVSVLLLADDASFLILADGLGVASDDIGKLKFPKNVGLAWKVVNEGVPVIVNDLTKVSEYLPGKISENSLLLVPISTKNGIAGVLAVADKKDRSEFSSKDEKLLSTIAHQMGAVWENAKLYRETRELFLNTVEALSAAIDAKDPYTHGHSRRVTDFSVAIATEMKMAEEEIELIRVSALLHDIGKLGISEAILRKPDKLTDEEFSQIKRHPVIGAEIMNHVKKLSLFIPGMIDHHERFNGTGYPDGHKGEAISLAGRIIAVADTFDAITSNRPYHPNCKGKPDEVGLNEIKRCSGGHFDPVVVEAFVKAYARGVIRQDVSLQA